MDITATQVYEETDSAVNESQPLSQNTQIDKTKKVGELIIESVSYPIYKGVNSIGRYPMCNIVMNDQTISKRHAEIEAGTRQSWICDLNSSNRTKLNNEFLRPSRYYRLDDGDTIDFGKLRAIYKFVDEMNDSLIPQTPAPSNAKKKHQIILETPDVPQNESSIPGEDLSVIPDTQADNEKCTFRRPSIPSERKSTDRFKIYEQGSSLEESMEKCMDKSSRTIDFPSPNVGDNTSINIHDMETQDHIELNDESQDTHEMPTQQIITRTEADTENNRDITGKCTKYLWRENIHDGETQNKSYDIHEVETQKDASGNSNRIMRNIPKDIHDMETQDLHNAETQLIENRRGDNKNPDIEASVSSVNVNVLSKSSDNRIDTSVSGNKSQNTKKNDDNNVESAKDNYSNDEDVLRLTSEQLKDNLSDLDVSAIVSQDLLQDYAEIRAEITVPKKVSNSNTWKHSTETEDEDEDDNIFDALTQVVNNDDNQMNSKSKVSVIDNSDSATNDEEAFQLFKKENEIVSKSCIKVQYDRRSQANESDSDDSITDEEGHFAEFIVNEKKLASISDFAGNKEKKNEKNDINESNNSRDSEDIFEAATQRGNSSTERYKKNVPMDKNENNEIDDMAPTQIISSLSADALKLSDHKEDAMEIDDTAPTQIISKTQSDLSNKSWNYKTDAIGVDDTAATQIISMSPHTESISKQRAIRRDEIEIDDMAPTQLIMRINVKSSGKEKQEATETDVATQLISRTGIKDALIELSDGQRPPSARSVSKTDIDVLKELIESSDSDVSVGDVDYETAPTQLLDDATGNDETVSQSEKVEVQDRSKEKSCNKPENLDRTVEKNLNEIFDKVEDRSSYENTSIMSTQCLTDVLESTQIDQTMNKSEKTPSRKNRSCLSLWRNLKSPSTPCTKSILSDDSRKRKSLEALASAGEETQRSEDTRKINFDDSIERNLSNIFEGINEESVETRSHLSTQCLQDILQPSENRADLSVPSNRIPENNKTTYGLNNRQTTTETPTPNPMLKDETPRDNESNTLDSQNSEHYFANLTTRNKCNATRDSEESSEKQKKTNEEISSTWSAEKNKEIEDSDEDLLANLPPVKILGTSSNPVSPASSTSTVRNYSSIRTVGTNREMKRARLTVQLSRTVNTKNEENKSPVTRTRRIRSTRSNKRSKFSETVCTNTESSDVEPDDDLDFEQLKEIADRLLSVPSRYDERSKILKKVRDTNSNRDHDDDRHDHHDHHDHDDDDDDDDDDDVQSTNVQRNTRSTKKRRISIDSLKDESANNHPCPVRKSPPIRTRKRFRGFDKQDDQNTCVFQVNETPAEEVFHTSTGCKTATERHTSKRSLTTVDGNVESNAKRRKGTNNEEKTSKSMKVSNTESLSTKTKEMSNFKNAETNSKQLKTTKGKDTSTSIGTKPSRKSRNKNESSGTLNLLTPSNSSKNTRTESDQIIVPNAVRQLNPVILVKQVKMENNKSSGEGVLDVENKGRKNGRLRRTSGKSSSSASSQSKRLVNDGKVENADSNKNNTRASRTGPAADPTVESHRSTTKSKSTILEKAKIIPTNTDKRRTRNSVNSRNTNNSDSSEESQEIQRIMQNSSSASSKSHDSNKGERGGSTISDNGQVRSTPNRRSARNKSKGREDTSTSGTECMDNSVLSRPTTRSASSSMLNMSALSRSKTKCKVVFTGISSDEYSNALKKLGIVEVTDYAKCDILITDKVRRTVKFLCALAQAVPIISIEWLNDSEAAGKLLNWDDYIVKDPVTEAKFGFKLRKSLERSKEKKLLDGYTVVLAPNVAPPSIPELKSMIISCGGRPLIRPPMKWDKNTVILSREEDLQVARKLISQAPKSVTVQSTEFILTGILKQELDFTKYRLVT